MREIAARTVARGVALAVVAATLLAHALRFGFVTDDAYVSFVYARNLAEHGQLVFNLGRPPVEGYTNFLWTVLLAGCARVGLPLEGCAIVLGLGFALATMIVVWRLGARLVGRPSAHDLVAPALLALSAGYACWASGGLETQLFTFLVTLAIAWALPDAQRPSRVRHVGWLLALAALTRPEGVLVAAIVLGHRLVWNRLDRRPLLGRDEAIAALGFVGLVGPWFAWRWWYYGWPLPNTWYVKAAGDAPAGYGHQLHATGLYYVGQWAWQSGLAIAAPLVVVGLALAPRRSLRQRFGSLAIVLTLVYLAYTVSVGGDFMGLHRFVLPLVPLGALGVALGTDQVARWLAAEGRRARVVGASLAGVVLITSAVQQWRVTEAAMQPGAYDPIHGIDPPAFLAAYAHDRARVGAAMAPCQQAGDFAIYGGVGAQPFFGRIPGIDIFGLVSDRIAHEVPSTNPRPGHNKLAGDELLLTFDPTFVFSCYALHHRPERFRLTCDPGFWLARGYELATLHVPGLSQNGEYYTFLVKTSRHFDCPGLSRPPSR